MFVSFRPETFRSWEGSFLAIAWGLTWGLVSFGLLLGILPALDSIIPPVLHSPLALVFFLLSPFIVQWGLLIMSAQHARRIEHRNRAYNLMHWIILACAAFFMFPFWVMRAPWPLVAQFAFGFSVLAALNLLIYLSFHLIDQQPPVITAWIQLFLYLAFLSLGIVSLIL